MTTRGKSFHELCGDETDTAEMRRRVVRHQNDSHRVDVPSFCRRLYAVGFTDSYLAPPSKTVASWTLFALLLATPTLGHAQEPTLRIESLHVAQPEQTLHSVKIRIRNVSSEPQSGIVWYVLASPSEPEPWRINDYASSERAISLRPGRVVTVELGGPNEALHGQFALSVWLHVSRPASGERFHADMRGHDVPIVIAPPFSFSIDYLINPATNERDMNVLVRFSVRNNQERSAEIGIDYRITQRDEDPAPDMGQLSRAAEVAAGVDYVVTLRHKEPLPREKLKLTGWIYERVEGQLLYRGTDVTLIEPKD